MTDTKTAPDELPTIPRGSDRSAEVNVFTEGWFGRRQWVRGYVRRTDYDESLWWVFYDQDGKEHPGPPVEGAEMSPKKWKPSEDRNG